jgi:S1-C subfamily serine protease
LRSILGVCLAQILTFGLVYAQLACTQLACAQEASADTQGSNRPGSSAGNGPIEDLTSGVIDNRRIYNTFVNRGRRLISSDFPSDSLPQNTESLASEQIRQMLKSAPNRLEVRLPEIPEVSREEFHDRLRRASMMIGTLYDCGRCKNLHANISGGVVIGQDGLVLTNYHVLDRKDDQKVQAMVAMDCHGRCFAIAEVLAAWESADVVLIRLQSTPTNDSTATKFEPVRLASWNPKPLTDVVVMSHPHNEFYVVTTGLASRLTKPTMEGDSNTWLEITAEFSGGSSGSGVFNTQGELVGLVSRIHPMFREQEKSGADRSGGAGQARDTGAGRQFYPEQILRRCVPIESIHKLLTAR